MNLYVDQDDTLPLLIPPFCMSELDALGLPSNTISDVSILINITTGPNILINLTVRFRVAGVLRHQ